MLPEHCRWTRCALDRCDPSPQQNKGQNEKLSLAAISPCSGWDRAGGDACSGGQDIMSNITGWGGGGRVKNAVCQAGQSATRILTKFSPGLQRGFNVVLHIYTAGV